MENPPAEIKDIVLTLCTRPRAEQQAAITKYFTADAEFVHPLCRVPPFAADVLGGLFYGKPLHIESRRAIAGIYRWYKLMSPRIDIGFESVAWDADSRMLYVALHQRFALWFMPFYEANVRLVTELSLRPITTEEHRSYAEVAAAHAAALSAQSPGSSASAPVVDGDGPTTRFYITRQEDHYQINELIKFFGFSGLQQAGLLWYLIQLLATAFSVCAAGAIDLVWGCVSVSGTKSVKRRK